MTLHFIWHGAGHVSQLCGIAVDACGLTAIRQPEGTLSKGEEDRVKGII